MRSAALILLLFGLVSLTQLRSHGFNPVTQQLVMGKQDNASWLICRYFVEDGF